MEAKEREQLLLILQLHDISPPTAESHSDKSWRTWELSVPLIFRTEFLTNGSASWMGKPRNSIEIFFFKWNFLFHDSISSLFALDWEFFASNQKEWNEFDYTIVVKFHYNIPLPNCQGKRERAFVCRQISIPAKFHQPSSFFGDILIHKEKMSYGFSLSFVFQSNKVQVWAWMWIGKENSLRYDI